tara:strand:- start:467 stop:688 length:222 start_codon:yes stop_codon:yes gene_type:complete
MIYRELEKEQNNVSQEIMIAELIVLQQLLEKTNMVTPTNNSTNTSSTADKARAAVKEYTEKVTSYLERFKYRR